MATVYRATAADGHLIALKVLAIHLATDRTARTRFEQESNLGLVHPNIVHVRKAGVEGDTPFIEMDYVPGESLDRIIVKNGPLTPAQFVPILKNAADALEYAHARGIVHRDVKPSNLIVRSDGQALLADFGVAKAAGMTAFTATQARVGSVYYMSPEQASGSFDITRASDIYSLGITAFYALTGRHPFEGDNEIAIARMHVDRRPAHISDINPKVPRHVGDVIMQALEKAPSKRQASAGEFARLFAKAVESPAPPPVPLVITPAQPQPVQPMQPASPLVDDIEARSRIPASVFAAIGLVALLGLGVLGVALLEQREDSVNGTNPAGITVVPSVPTVAPPSSTLPPDQVLTPVGNAPLPTLNVTVFLVETVLVQPAPTWTPFVVIYPTLTRVPSLPPAPLPIVTSPVISPLPTPTLMPTVPPPTVAPTLPPPPTATVPPTIVPPPTDTPAPPPPTSTPAIIVIVTP